MLQATCSGCALNMGAILLDPERRKNGAGGKALERLLVHPGRRDVHDRQRPGVMEATGEGDAVLLVVDRPLAQRVADLEVRCLAEVGLG